MSIPKGVIRYLDKKGIKYKIVPHKKVFTAYDLAQTLGEKLEKVAKTLLLSVELPEIRGRGKHYIVAVPASYQVEFDRVRRSLKAKRAQLAPERVMKRLGITPGALSPFAAMHNLELLLDKALLKSKEALVRAGSLTESIRIRTRDLHKMENAIAGVFGRRSGVKLTVKKKTAVKIKRRRARRRSLRRGR